MKQDGREFEQNPEIGSCILPTNADDNNHLRCVKVPCSTTKGYITLLSKSCFLSTEELISLKINVASVWKCSFKSAFVALLKNIKGEIVGVGFKACYSSSALEAEVKAALLI